MPYAGLMVDAMPNMVLPAGLWVYPAGGPWHWSIEPLLGDAPVKVQCGKVITPELSILPNRGNGFRRMFGGELLCGQCVAEPME
jgi:hypothetical protein